MVSRNSACDSTPSRERRPRQPFRMDVNILGLGRNNPFSIDSLMSEHTNEYMPQMMPMGRRAMAPLDCCYEWAPLNSNCYSSNTMKDMEGKNFYDFLFLKDYDPFFVCSKIHALIIVWTHGARAQGLKILQRQLRNKTITKQKYSIVIFLFIHLYTSKS